MGQVFVAKDTRLDRTVAVKVLTEQLAFDAEARARFQREAKTIALLTHPNICALYDVGEDQGHPFLVMELLAGETLAARLTRGALPVQEAISTAIQITDALKRAHALGIVHRDLKPANVMLTKSGAKLLDFGLAKLRDQSITTGFDETRTQLPLTTTGTILGTLNYMSPEQVRGEAVDQRADLFALGCVLYEMITGRMAFSGSNAASVMGAILERRPDLPTTIQSLTPRGVELILLRCLEKDPNDRFSSAGDLRFALEAATLAPCEPVIQVKRRPSVLLATVGATAIVLTAAVMSYFRVAPRTLDVDSLVFAVEPPAGKLLSPIASYPDFAVSPDSKYLVLTVSENAGSSLALKRHDSVETTILAGGAGGSLPFWSPDSRHVAFFADGALKRLPIDGGPVEQICRISDVMTNELSGTWNEDGQILFSAMEGLLHVAAAGGTPTVVLKNDEGDGRLTTYRHPTWLPGGKHFLMSVLRPQGAGVYIGTIGGDEPHELLRDAARAVYTRSGHVLFVRQGILLAQSFDVGTYSLRGSATPVASGVAYQAGRAAFTVSDAGFLFYRRQQAASRFVWMDRSGTNIGDIGEPGDRLNPRISPDGRRLAFEQHDAEGRGDLWSMDLQRSLLTRLTFDGAHAQRPAWSPDGTRLAYSDQRLGLVIQSADGTTAHARWAAPTGARRRPSDWTPDAKHLIYEEEGRDTKLDIWTVEIPNGTPQPLLRTQFTEGGARLSANGQWLVYSSDESGVNEVYVRRFPSGVNKVQISTAGGIAPRWNPDGREIFYVARTGELRSVAIEGSEHLEVGISKRLFQVELRGANGQIDYEVATANRFLMSVVVPGHSSLVGISNWIRSLE